jgi:hypothetical protein
MHRHRFSRPRALPLLRPAAGFLLFVATTALAGCEPDVRTVDWEVAFPDTELESRVHTVVGRILPGGCDSDEAPLYEGVARRPDAGVDGEASMPAAPPALPEGRYGVMVQGLASDCRVVAEQCEDTQLPLPESGPLRLILRPLRTLRCRPELCGGSECSASCPTVDAIAVGARHSCVATSLANELWCWGANDEGQLGDTGPGLPPRVVVYRVNNTAKLTAAGRAHTCTRAPETICLGRNEAGQLGRGAASAFEEPGSVELSPDSLGLGRAHTCLVSRNRLYCFGDNGRGQLGHRPTDPTLPSPLPGERVWERVAAGGDVTCAAADGDTRLFCFGAGEAGQLGTGRREDLEAPSEPGLEPPDLYWSAFAVGPEHVCAISAERRYGSGDLYCWGRGSDGRLGLGSSEDRSTPVKLEVPWQWRRVAAGARHTCGVRSDGELYCWGANERGQLGIDEPSVLVPERVPGFSQVSQVAAGEAHTCVIQNEDAHCFGDNRHGQLGDARPGPAPRTLCLR